MSTTRITPTRIYRTAQGTVHATDGMCTHGNTHLADGLVRGTVVECPKHNGRFDVVSGEPRRLPACVALADLPRAGGGRPHPAGRRARRRVRRHQRPCTTLQVVSNRNVATFIKELVLAPRETTGSPDDREPGRDRASTTANANVERRTANGP